MAKLQQGMFTGAAIVAVIMQQRMSLLARKTFHHGSSTPSLLDR